MKKCIILVGATCSNKTLLAYTFAKKQNIPVISADSRQCFKELNIGVAKPSVEMLSVVPHYFINSHSIHNIMNTKIFERYALKKVSEIVSVHPFCLMAGGSGLYIKAFSEGLTDIPEIPAYINQEINHYYRLYGREGLRNSIQKEDILFFRYGAMENPYRMMRALAVKRATGRSVITFHKQAKTIQRPFEIHKIGIAVERDILYRNIENRVDEMLRQGLISEAEKLMSYCDLPNLQTIGYKEIFAYLKGTLSLSEAVSLIKQHTRNYAKRQLTWFRSDKKIKWLKSAEVLGELFTLARSCE